MKIRSYLALAAAALVMTNCSQEEVAQISQSSKVITATIESSSRSAVTDAGVFSWTSGDEISLHDGTNVDTYTYSGTGNDFTEPSASKVETPVVAYYPANASHTTTSFYLPATYDVGSTNAAMMATPPASGSTYAFKHLGGMMRFIVKDVPAEATQFVLKAVGKKITGKFSIENGIISTEATSSTDNQVTINFTISAKQDMTFYVPLPVGKYEGYQVCIKNESSLNLTETSSETAVNTIARKTLLLMPTFTCTASGLTKGESIDDVIKLAEGSQSAAISDNAEVVVTAGTDADATATLNYTPATDGSSVLSISDGSGATASGDSEGNVVVSTADGSTVASCDINTPSLTVELSAAENGTATYEEVTALTAENTLIIGKGVTINKLIVKGGNVVLKGNVKSIESEVATTIKLENDIVSDEIITISGPITIDGNDKTLTSTADRAINVDTGGSVTIQNLTINAAERAINIINKAATVNVNKVTATANNNAIMIATSAGAAKLTVEDSDLTGLAVINVAGEGAQVEIKSTKITCNDQNANEAYGAITFYVTAENSTVSVDANSTISVEGDSKNAYVFPETATITGVDNVGYVYAAIGDNGCESLAEAIEEANAGQTITILRDITASEIITINKAITLDGNGKTLTSTADRAINVETDGSVTIQNLTINAAERAINIINKAATVNVNKVTATAKNNAIMIATSAGAAKLTVKESDLTGLAVINVAGAGAEVAISNTKITNVDPVGTDEAYGAITISGTAENSKVSVSGGSIVVADNSKKAYVFPGTAVIEGVDNVGYVYATIGDNGCESLAEAIEEANAGQTITILRDIEITELIAVNKAITIDLNEKTVTAKCQKAFEIYSDATIKNGTIISQQRCVDTREAVNLTLTDLTLNAPTYYAAHGNQQPLTIGGSEAGTKVTMSNVTMDAGYQGYCIISFVKTELTATDSNLSGYAALYVKEGSEGSEFKFENSTLSGTNGNNDVEGNSFATIAIDANNVAVVLDSECTLTATGTHHKTTYISEGVTGSTITGPTAE